MKLPRPHHLSAQQLAGQVLMPALSIQEINREAPGLRRLRNWVRKFHLGGLIIFGGHPAQVRFLTWLLNQEADIPLLFAADFERGLRPIVERGTTFPHAMAYGAAQDESLVREMARVIAREARSTGVNVLFAPVLDLCEHPQDTIINIRAFHSQPEEVARLAGAFVQEAQKLGLACVGKHFPGHGATGVDSHIALPVLEKNLSDMDADLFPFQKAVEQDIAGLMVGHLAEKSDPTPMPFRKDVVHRLLRQAWRFQGVVFTDALNMAAVAEHYSPAHQGLLALQAGCDILLMPDQLPLVHRTLVEAIERDEAFARQVRAAVERIFRLKKWLHKHQPAQTHPYRVFKLIEHPNHIGLALKAAEQSLTLLHAGKGFPLDLPRIQRVRHLIFTDGSRPQNPLRHFNRELSCFFDQVEVMENPEHLEERWAPATGPDLVVVSVLIRTFAGNAQQLEEQKISATCRFLQKKKIPWVLIVFGNPYRLARLKSMPLPRALLLAYSYVDCTQRAAFRGLCSFVALRGKLPIPLPPPFQQARELEAREYRLLPAKPPTRPAWPEVDRWISRAIEEKIFPGGVLLVAAGGQVRYWKAYGKLSYEAQSPPVQPDTVYDLASLTKVLATTPAVFRLVQEGQLSLEDRLEAFYPRLQGKPQGAITVARLLTHSSGWPDWRPFYQTCSSKNALLEAVLETPLVYAPGEKILYSDLGFLVLGDLVERLSGISLADYVRSHFYQPMGLQSLQFCPPERLARKIPPTGRDEFRQRIVQGEVNDTNAWVAGGIAGHAGLFGHALDVAAMAQMVLWKGIYQSTRLLKAKWVETMTRSVTIGQMRRAMGWDVPAPGNSAAGDLFSASSIGHLAFTGPSLWIDLERAVIVLFLCNRSHPDPKKNRMAEFRPELHNRVMARLLKKDQMNQ